MTILSPGDHPGTPATSENYAAPAAELIRGGISVLPLSPVWVDDKGKKQGKTPTIKWGAFQKAPMSLERVGSAFAGDVGIAAVCGEVSGNLILLDFDAPGFLWRYLRRLTPEDREAISELNREVLGVAPP